MEDITILSRMIADSASVPLGSEGGKPTIRLQDSSAKSGAKAGKSEVCIRNAPPDAFIIRADCFPDLRGFFQGDRGESKRADFIVISEIQKIILYIELKLGPGDAGDIKKQLNGAACVLSYCKEAGKRFWHEKKFLEGYDHRYIGIVNIGKNKRAFDRQLRSGRDVENYRKIYPSKNLCFSKLVGKS